MQNLKNKLYIIFLCAGLILTIIYILVFSPVYTTGDAPSYIRYAQALADGGNTGTYLQRSPLYPLLLALIIKTAGIGSLPQVIVIIQFLLIFFSSIILFNILNRFLTLKLSLFSVLLFFFSLSTVHFGYMVLTEILTLFLFLLSVLFLVKWVELKKGFLLIILGLFFSLLVLARFNTLPLIVSFLLIIIYVLLISERRISFFGLLYNSLKFLLPVALILNAYAFYNYKVNNFYGLFPAGGSSLISRNAILATIDGTETVSEKNKPVYDIFMEAIDRSGSRIRSEKKASLLKIWDPEFASKLYIGFPVYNSARKPLCDYFGIDSSTPEPYLSVELSSFYSEIVSQNRGDITMMRFYSLLNSFRSSTGLTIAGDENLNLGRLPAWVILTYKIIIIIISIFTFLTVILYCGYSIIKRKIINPFLLSFIILYLSYYFINFFFVIASDSNRYKFPAEPIMFGLFVFFMAEVVWWLRKMFKSTLKLRKN